MTTHHLKCYPAYFEAVACGDKPFELRKDDRAYQLGDTLVLEEYDPIYFLSGRSVTRRIFYVLRGGPWLADGYVALGLREETQ